MPPKQQRVIVEKATPRRATPKGYVASTYNSLTNPENASVVRSVAIFGVCCSYLIIFLELLLVLCCPVREDCEEHGVGNAVGGSWEEEEGRKFKHKGQGGIRMG
jgi:hypothetical protein